MYLVCGDILRSKDQEKEKKWARNPDFKKNNFATRVGDSRNVTPKRNGAPGKNCVIVSNNIAGKITSLRIAQNLSARVMMTVFSLRRAITSVITY